MVQLVLCCQAVETGGSWPIPKEEAEGDFCKDLRTLFATELCTNITNTTLTVYLNKIAERIGAKKLSHPKPSEDQIRQVLPYFTVNKPEALIATIQPTSLQTLIETKATLNEICDEVKKIVTEH